MEFFFSLIGVYALVGMGVGLIVLFLQLDLISDKFWKGENNEITLPKTFSNRMGYLWFFIKKSCKIFLISGIIGAVVGMLSYCAFHNSSDSYDDGDEYYFDDAHRPDRF